MALITKPPASMARKAVTVRMPQPIAETLHEYATFIGSSLDHVVVEALKLVFRKDAEFKAWQDQQPHRAAHASAARASAESTPATPSPLFNEPKRSGRRNAAIEDAKA